MKVAIRPWRRYAGWNSFVRSHGIQTDMAYNEKTSAKIFRILQRRKGFVGKRMFGGFGYMLNGNMCCGVWKEFLILRVGPDNYPAMMSQPHVRKFDITGREMRGWVMVEPEGFPSEAELRRLLDQAIEFTRKLPSKVPAEN